MVAVGVTETSAPLLAARLPGVMTAVPLANELARVEISPAAMDVGPAMKEVITGAGTTVTVAEAVTWAPSELVTVRV